MILANGLLALAEIAVVSSRKHRLQQRAEGGDRKAAVALELANEPNQLLSTVQIGITLIGILAGAFGGATLAEQLAVRLDALPYVAPHGESVAIALVVFVITLFSVILGELVPKRLALTNPERFASAMAPFMKMLSKLASPAVRFLSWSTEQILRFLPKPHSEGTEAAEEEIKVLLEQGAESGDIAEAEQEMVEGVFQLGDRRVVELMKPRSKVAWLDINGDPEEIRNLIAGNPHSRLPVGDGSLDRVVGFVHVKDLLGQCLTGYSPDLKSAIRTLPAVPETITALNALDTFKKSGTHIAVVVNEHGGTEGIITLNDVVEAVVGDLPAPNENPDLRAKQREDGSRLVDGTMPISEFKELTEIRHLAGEEGVYTTLAGFMLMELGRIRSDGDHFECAGWRFEVVDMDGKRIDKVLVTKTAHSGRMGNPQAQT